MKISSKMGRRVGLMAAVAIPAAMLALPAIASHSWSTYHWKRTTAELTVPVGDNVDANWDSYLNAAIADWNNSTVINSPKVAGTTNPKNCRAVAGTIQVCNGKYGNTGWLGIASISLSGGHISQGTTKLNDTYFNTPQYNTYSWKSLVTCQEIGHDYGLGHQDEDFSTDNTNSCMDYTSLPAGNEHPDAHDYQQLLDIYNHLESAAGLPGGSAAIGVEVGDTPATWGRPIHFDRQGRPDYFERIDSPGQRTITHVFWTLDARPQRGGHHHD
jgi:hypothetical protein